MQTSIPSLAQAYQVGKYGKDAYDTQCTAIAVNPVPVYSLIDPTNPVLGVQVSWDGGSASGCP